MNLPRRPGATRCSVIARRQRPRRPAAALTDAQDGADGMSASTHPWRSHRAEAIRTRTMRPCFMKFVRRSDAGRGGLAARVPTSGSDRLSCQPAGGRLPCLVRQASVRFSDDFAVFQVQGPGFCDQLANTCEPASGFGGTVRNIRRLHDETPDKWWIRDNPNHKETSPLCEMRFRYMRITDILCCYCATRSAPMRTVVASRCDEAVASTASHRGNGKREGSRGG